MSDDLVHIVDWPRFVRYAREDRSHADNWRPPYVNVDVSATLDKLEDMTEAQVGCFFLLVLEYASCPALDPSLGPKGPRRMSAARARRALRVHPPNRQRMMERLLAAGLIEVSEDAQTPRREHAEAEQTPPRDESGPRNRAGLDATSPGHRQSRQQQTREDLRPRPRSRPSPARASATAPVEDQDLEIGEGTAAAASPEPASESEIREAVASLAGADRQSLGVVEPLARSVTRETFLGLVDRARTADNPVGWLVARLRAVHREAHLEWQEAAAAAVPVHAPEPIERLSPEQALEANVRQLADNDHSWEAIAEHVSAVFGVEHLETARAIYDRGSEAAA